MKSHMAMQEDKPLKSSD